MRPNVRHTLQVVLTALLLAGGGGFLPVSRVASGASTTPEAARRWWSFRPVADQAPPAVKDEAWARNEVDRFVLAKLEAEGMQPPPLASKRVLIRRATFDLTGLPPAPDEIDAFLADQS